MYYVSAKKGLIMNVIVEYVKDLTFALLPVHRGNATSNDADLLVEMALDMQYIVAQNGVTYWYYIVDEMFLSDARNLLRQNGLKPRFHKSKFYMGGVPVLRIRKSNLEKDIEAKNFVASLMKKRKMSDDTMRSLRQR